MKVYEAIRKLRKITKDGYGMAEIVIESYAEIEEQPDTLYDIYLVKPTKKMPYVKFEVA